MLKIARIAFINLYRQKRRTLLTIFIIAFGVIAVLLFSAVAGSFKSMMIGRITDSMLGHIQIHRKGYVESLDNMPLNLVIENENLEMKHMCFDIEIANTQDAMPDPAKDKIAMISVSFSPEFAGKKSLVLVSKPVRESKDYVKFFQDEKSMLEEFPELLKSTILIFFSATT